MEYLAHNTSFQLTVNDVPSKPGIKQLERTLKAAGLKIATPIKKLILSSLGERDQAAAICLAADGSPEPDADLRDYEMVPLGESWRDFVDREVIPHIPDAWVDETYCDARDGSVGRIGYDVNFKKFFYRYSAPRPLSEIDDELARQEVLIADLLREMSR